jgi:hypothetical protein
MEKISISSVIHRIICDQNLKLGHFQVVLQHSNKPFIVKQNLRKIDLEQLCKNTVKVNLILL